MKNSTPKPTVLERALFRWYRRKAPGKSDDWHRYRIETNCDRAEDVLLAMQVDGFLFDNCCRRKKDSYHERAALKEIENKLSKKGPKINE